MIGKKLFGIVPLFFAALMCISGCDDGNNADNGDTVTIGSFALLGPSDDLEIDGYTPTFSWNAAENAESYRLIVATNRNFNQADIVEEITVTGTSATIRSSLDTQMTYHWYVEAAAPNAEPRQCTRRYVFYTKPWTLDFNKFTDTAAFNTYMTANGGSNQNAEIDSTAVTGKKTLKIDGNKTIELDKLWGNITNYDTIIIDYYASAPFNPMMRLYSDRTGTGIYGCYDFNTEGGAHPAVPLSAGNGILRFPVSSEYMSVVNSSGTIVSNPAGADSLVNPSNIRILGFGSGTGGSLYIKSITLIKVEKMSDKIEDFTSIQEAEALASKLIFIQGSGYRLVVQESFKTSSSYMNLGTVFYKEFAINNNAGDQIVLMEIMTGVMMLGSGNFIYTFYSPGGSIFALGRLTVN
jgi:hypothetical protein